MAVLSGVVRVGLIEEVMFEQKHEGRRGNESCGFLGRIFQAEGTASTKALWQEPAKCVPRTLKRPVGEEKRVRGARRVGSEVV